MRLRKDKTFQDGLSWVPLIVLCLVGSRLCSKGDKPRSSDIEVQQVPEDDDRNVERLNKTFALMTPTNEWASVLPDLDSKSHISVCGEGNLRQFFRSGATRHAKRVFASDMLAEQGDCPVKKSPTVMVSLLLLGTSAQAQMMPDADQLKAKIATIEAKYKPRS